MIRFTKLCANKNNVVHIITIWLLLDVIFDDSSEILLCRFFLLEIVIGYVHTNGWYKNTSIFIKNVVYYHNDFI